MPVCVSIAQRSVLIHLIGQLRRDVIGRLSVKPWCYWLWRLVISNQSIITSSDVIQLTLTLTLPHRLSKRHSLSTTTVLFRTTFTRTIKLNLLPSFSSFKFWSILETGHFVEVVSIFLPLVLVKKKKKKKKTLQKAKNLFKLNLFSLSKDSLVNSFWENLSNFCQFIFVFNCDMR